MTEDEIVVLANKITFMDSIWVEDESNEFKEMIAFAKLVAQHEREACAKICEDLDLPFVADAIHARKNK
jgi:hypothetical protein